MRGSSRTPLRTTALALVLGGCSTIVGIGDIPTPEDGGPDGTDTGSASGAGSSGSSTSSSSGSASGSSTSSGGGSGADGTTDGNADSTVDGSSTSSGGSSGADGTTDGNVDSTVDGSSASSTSSSGATSSSSSSSSGGEAGCDSGATQCSGNSVQTCSGGTFGTPVACGAPTPFCYQGACTATPPSCQAGGAGMTNCGSGGDGGGTESCCASLFVPGGTFYRTYTNNGSGPTGLADPATVSSFHLDKYDVTVGRFRQFVNAWSGGSGWTPPAGSGKHTHLNGGQGLVNGAAPADAGTVYETGWVATDDSNVAPTNTNLGCTTSPGPGYATWTSTPTGTENLPINCVNLWEAEAFCIWDGGFLPSEAELAYAMAGGSDQREYAWGSTAPGTANQYAIYGCYEPSGSGTCTGIGNIAPVGTATLGAGRWGQLDLEGNMYQHILDRGGTTAYVNPCVDCANLPSSGNRGGRGTAFNGGLGPTTVVGRDSNNPAIRYPGLGFRCARTPLPCTSGQTQCASYTQSQTCTSSGAWGAATTCTNGPCVAGACQSPVTLASAQNGPTGIAVDGSNVYWATSGGGTIMRVPIGGGTAATLSTGQGGAGVLAGDGTNVYWTRYASSNTISAVPKAGGTTVSLASGSYPQGIASDGTNVYWASTNGYSCASGSVASVPVGGGTASTFFSTSNSNPIGVAVDTSNIYWTSCGTGGGVIKEAKGGGSPVTLMASTSGLIGVAVDATSAYATAASTVLKVPIGGGTVVTLATGRSSPGWLTADGQSVYWVEGTSTGNVMSVPAAGGAPVTLASAQNGPFGIAIDATNVYWTTNGGGTVMQLRVK